MQMVLSYSQVSLDCEKFRHFWRVVEIWLAKFDSSHLKITFI